jgi:hypothetical protein
MRSKKSPRSAATVRTNKTAARNTATMSSWTIALVVCVVTAVVLIGARETSPSADVAPIPIKAQAVALTTPVVPVDVTTTATPKTASAAKATTTVWEPKALGPVAGPKTPTTIPDLKTSVQEPGAATIAGCLERDGETFRLKDTSGVDMPKARSWKSGFLKKGSASIEVVDAASGLNLPGHIGQRVSVSGTLADREIQARSLRRVAVSCG